MKDFIKSFRRLIRFIVTVFASREFAFIYCLSGTAAQITHTYFLTSAISSFSGGFKVFQATLIAFFISSSLLFFVAISDGDNPNQKEQRKIMWAVNIFMLIEILINFYYYSRHLIIDVPKIQVFDFIFAVLVSCLLPVTIKLYANIIKAREWIAEMSENELTPAEREAEKEAEELRYSSVESALYDVATEVERLEENNKLLEIKISEQLQSYGKNMDEQFNQLTEIVENKIETEQEKINQNIKFITEGIEKSLELKIEEATRIPKSDILSESDVKQLVESQFSETISKLDSSVANVFEKNKQLFLTQFENKCQIILKKQLESVSVEAVKPWNLRADVSTEVRDTTMIGEAQTPIN